ncbi:MAG: class I SAM-dependent methyltransferase [Actinomycetota bacterium]
MAGSISFDPAADYYDRTRVTDAVSIEAAVDLLDATLPPGRTLEIGVGTGALAVPIARRGRRVVGVDLSASMLAKLRDKDPERRVASVRGDATMLPFGAGAFEGAYCRWVLHLIADWTSAVGELCRVVRSGGAVVVEPGGYSGQWRTVWLRFVEELGPSAEPLGLDARGGYADLDEVFAGQGATFREVRETAALVDSSLNRFFEETAARTYSWTWRVPPEDLAPAIEVVRSWAIERYGPDLDSPFEPAAPHVWRVYDLPG